MLVIILEVNIGWVVTSVNTGRNNGSINFFETD